MVHAMQRTQRAKAWNGCLLSPSFLKLSTSSIGYWKFFVIFCYWKYGVFFQLEGISTYPEINLPFVCRISSYLIILFTISRVIFWFLCLMLNNVLKSSVKYHSAWVLTHGTPMTTKSQTTSNIPCLTLLAKLQICKFRLRFILVKNRLWGSIWTTSANGHVCDIKPRNPKIYL